MNLENILRAHWSFLRENTTNILGILAELYSKCIISREEIELIKNPIWNATSNDKNDSLYNTLVRKNLEPEILKNILLETSNKHIVMKVWGNFSKDEYLIFWNAIPRNDHFTGRSEILEILEKHLDSKKWENSTLKFVLYGMGGVGKTSIVNEFLYRNRKKFSNIFWFGAQEKMNFFQQVCRIAKKLEFGNNDYIDSVNKYEFAKSFFNNWFNKKSGWIIVYDNVENFEDIQNFIPRLGGIVLITSRKTTKWPNVNDISLNYFKRSESCNFIQKILQLENHDDQEFENLSADLGHLPLAVSNACNYIRGNKMAIKDYLEYSKMAEEEFLTICPHFEEKSVWKSVKISLDKTKEESPLAFEFLQIISFLQAEEIPKLFLEEFAEIKEIEDKMQIIEIQKHILKYDLVKLEIRDEHQLYSIHQLVQKSIKLNVKDEYEILLICSEIIKKVCIKYTSLEANYILHHAISLLLYLIEFVQKRKNGKYFAKLQKLDNAILDLISSANYLLPWLSEIEDIDKIFNNYFEEMEKFIMDSNDIYKLYWAMALCFRAQNDFQNALKIAEKLLVICQEMFGEFSSETSKVYNDLSVCYSNLGQFSKALDFYEKSLKIDIQLHEIDSSELISKYNNLGNICFKLNDYKKAQEYLDQGLKLVHEHQLEDTFEAAHIYSNLGFVNFELNDLENSRVYLNKFIEVFALLYGENSLQIFNELKEMGDYFVDSNPSFALEFYEKLSDFETKYQNGPSRSTLRKIQTCNQRRQHSFFGHISKIFSFK